MLTERGRFVGMWYPTKSTPSTSITNPKIPLPILILMTMLVQWQPVENMDEYNLYQLIKAKDRFPLTNQMHEPCHLFIHITPKAVS